MTIADIYDALTASDRPYKKSIPPSEALDILEQERRAGHLDDALLDVFVEARIYEQALTPRQPLNRRQTPPQAMRAPSAASARKSSRPTRRLCRC